MTDANTDRQAHAPHGGHLPAVPQFLLRTLGALALLLGVLPVCLADELHLSDGRTIVGKVSRDGDDYVIVFDGGASARYPSSEVARLDKMPTARERYENLKAVTPADDYQAQMEIGNWCRLNLLPEEARTHFLRALELRPNDPAASKAAGFVKFEGKWVTREEALTLQGKAVVDGKEVPLAQALEIRRKAEEQRLRSEGYTKAWKLLQSLSDSKDKDAFAAVRAQLLEMGSLSTGAVMRFTENGNPRLRGLCLELLAANDADDCRKALFLRLREESTPELVRKAARQLSLRKDKDIVLKQALDLCLNGEQRIPRQRSWLILRQLADKPLIEALIEAAEYCPVPPEERSDATKEQKDGWQSSVDYRPPRAPYFPACEALNYLTGADLRPNKEEWQRWWKKHGDTFDFKARSASEDKQDEDEKNAKSPEKSGKDAPAGNGQKAKTGEKSDPNFR